MHTRLLLFAFLSAAVASARSEEMHVGSIKGEVLDAKGSPIAAAKVFDQPLEAARIGKDHFAASDGSIFPNTHLHRAQGTCRQDITNEY
jgi:hypothetical protein